jgi:hypothetical protein
MKVRRRKAIPQPGHPASPAVFPICEAVRWLKHGDHHSVNEHGLVKNIEGRISEVKPGDYLVEVDGGVVHHPIDEETFTRVYEVLE